MANTKTKERIATADTATAEGLARTDLSEVKQALATVEGADKGDIRGKEGISTDDVVLPFLAICQKTSPQLEPDHAKYIDGLKFTDLFNSLTSEVYEQPVRFIPVILKKHAIEFNPFDQGGGIKDRNVAWDDERCQFQGDEKPSATRFYDWAVLLLPSMELIVLSFKSTNISVAKQFNQLIQLRQGPAFAGVYTVKVVSAKNQYGSFGKLAVAPAGRPTTEQYEFAATVYEGIKGKNLVVEHEAEPEPEATERAVDGVAERVPF